MSPEEINNLINGLRNEIEELRYLIIKKTGLGSADIKGNIVSPSTVGGTVAAGSIDQTAIGANAVGQSEWKYEAVNVSISAGNLTGTAGVTSGSIVVGWYATGNQAQLVDNIAVSSTTLTITLAANATATNTFTVVLLKT